MKALYSAVKFNYFESTLVIILMLVAQMLLNLKLWKLPWMGFMLLGPSLADGSEITVKLATGESYKPVIDFQKPGGGPLVENVRLVFQDMGIEARIEPMPWKRAYLETQKATYLATFPWYKDSEREKDFYFSDPLFVKPTVAVLRKFAEISRLSVSNLANQVTCDLLGSTIWNKLKADAAVRIVYVNDPAQCHQMLSNGRIDFMMMHPEQAEDFRKLGHRILKDELQLSFNGYLIISRHQPRGAQIIQKFNQSMKKLMQRSSWQPVFALPAQ